MGSSPGFNSFTSGTVRTPPSSRWEEESHYKPMTIHFQDRRGASSFRHWNGAVITLLMHVWTETLSSYGFRIGARAFRWYAITNHVIELPVSFCYSKNSIQSRPFLHNRSSIHVGQRSLVIYLYPPDSPSWYWRTNIIFFWEGMNKRSLGDYLPRQYFIPPKGFSRSAWIQA